MAMDIEQISLQIIANAGDARSFAFQALAEAKQGHFEAAEAWIRKSDAAVNMAHQDQAKLLFGEANGAKPAISVLLIHAQDHLMTGMLAVELIKEMILLYQKK